MKKVVGYVLTATAFVACPCHLVFLLPLALGLLGGTALGAALAANTGWVIAAATVYFVGALAGGIYLISRRARSEKERSSAPPSAGGNTGASTSGACLGPVSRRAGTGAGKR